jgi:hypothetical protein
MSLIAATDAASRTGQTTHGIVSATADNWQMEKAVFSYQLSAFSLFVQGERLESCALCF